MTRWRKFRPLIVRKPRIRMGATELTILLAQRSVRSVPHRQDNDEPKGDGESNVEPVHAREIEGHLGAEQAESEVRAA